MKFNTKIFPGRLLTMLAISLLLVLLVGTSIACNPKDDEPANDAPVVTDENGDNGDAPADNGEDVDNDRDADDEDMGDDDGGDAEAVDEDKPEDDGEEEADSDDGDHERPPK